jgi:RNA polymerase sigma-70 factor (ECF subfamily)
MAGKSTPGPKIDKVAWESYVGDGSTYVDLNVLFESNPWRLDLRYRGYCGCLKFRELSLPEPDLVEDDPIHLVEQIQAGIRVEENAEKLYKRFRRGVRSFFLRKGFTPQESDDLTQDVFLRVFKAIDTFRRESRFERWLGEIATHIYCNELRRRKTDKRDGREQSLDSGVESEDGVGPGVILTSDDPSPEDELIRTQRSKALQAALTRLPDQMRRCCIFRYERGLKYKDIAIVMGISIETVKAHLHQARKRLTAQLGGESDS